MTLLFSITLFLSAGLLFWLELMVAKLVLPLLGGSPQVWNTCVLFYQTLLLAAYYYAHVTMARLPEALQKKIHAVLLGLSLLVLPVCWIPTFLPPTSLHPIVWLLSFLTLSVGLPYFILAANGPLAQKRFSGDPYFLYALSNLGSVVALVSYPLWVESHWGLSRQEHLWTGLYGLAVLLVFFVIWTCRPAEDPQDDSQPLAASPPVTARQRWHWTLLAFIPSSLMLGVTTYFSSDIAPIPLLWVIPLTIYLVSFIVVFARHRWVAHEAMKRWLPLAVLPVGFLIMLEATQPIGLVMVIHLLFLLIACLVFHGELAHVRPSPRRLTEYYFWLALGGALGGIFNAILAPHIFTTDFEYPLTIMAACMLRPISRAKGDTRFSLLDVLIAVALAGLTTAVLLFPRAAGFAPWVLAGATVVCIFMLDHPVRSGLALGLLMLTSVSGLYKPGKTLLRARSFFGIHHVFEDPHGAIHWLTNGNVLHGGQALNSAHPDTPLTYYYPTGPIGQFLQNWPERHDATAVAVIGLGTGSLVSYGRPTEEWTFYEIDPVIVRIAQDTRLFTFLRDTRAKATVILGDARLSLASASEGHYDILILDAFGSDTVPVHLLTEEALRLYLQKIKTDGVLAFHVSHQYVNLPPVLGNLARDLHLTAIVRDDRASSAEQDLGKRSSQWVLMARDPRTLKDFISDPRWSLCPAQSGLRSWTDDFSSVLGVLKFN